MRSSTWSSAASANTQTTVRPSLLDLLHVPEWLIELISPRMADGILDEFDASVDRLLTQRGRAPDAEPEGTYWPA